MANDPVSSGNHEPVFETAGGGRLAGLRQKTLFRIAAAYAVAAWLVIQVAATVAPAFELSPWVVRAVILFAVLGFVATVAYFGFVRPASGETASDLKRTNRLASLAFGGVLVVAALAAVGFVARQTLFATEQVSLAVLPFADLSPRRDKAYFAEGVAEEILSSLGAEPDITVLGRTSARQLERDPDPAAIRASLGVTHLLEGSTRTAGDQLRVNVRLIDTSDGSQMWEEKYEGRLADVFSVQDQIAATVVKRLRGTFFGEAVREAQATTVDAYQAYLAARALMRTRSEKTLKEALELAKQVVRADADYAPGRALLAELYHLLSDGPGAYGTIPVADAHKLALPHARAAIHLAPNSPDGYAALGLISQPEASLEPLNRAIRLDPSRAEVRVWLGLDLGKLGRHDEALAQFRTAAEIEPLWPPPIHMLVQALAGQGLEGEALTTIRQFRARTGNKAQTFRFMAFLARYRSDLSQSIAYSRAALRADPEITYQHRWLATDFHLIGLPRQSVAELPDEFKYTRLLFSGDKASLAEQAQSAGSSLWRAPDADMAIFQLAASRDWPALARLHDLRPIPFREFCLTMYPSALAIAVALRNQARDDEAQDVLQCIRAIITNQPKMDFRAGGAGFDQYGKASLSALDGDRAGAMRWLTEAVERGWIGWPFSSRLADYPQFDALRGDPRFVALQQRIDRRIAQERVEVLALR